MKIAIDCRMLGSGGIGSYLAALLPFFVKEYECTLLGNEAQIKKYAGEQKAEHLYTIIDCPVQTFSLKELFFFPASILKKINECELFYTPYCNIPGGIKVPIFSTIHDVVFLDVPGLSGTLGTLARKWFYQHALNKSKKVFTVSNFSKERIQFHLSTKPDQIITTYNALPHWFYQDVNISIQKDNYILFVGNIKKHKGLKTLLDAFKDLLAQGKDAKLMIVGNSENFRTEDKDIWKQISACPKNSVIFTGRISDSELNEIYAKAKVLVQPSLYEGFGMPPLEALNLDTDVILSDIPVFKEIYANFPVTFFKCQDSKDLAQKLINGWDSFGKNSINVPDTYSFEKTFEIIKTNLYN
jgi:glycosyltransferase involved in cell wall biosynthesis